MKWIGITGGIGTGKTTASNYLRSKGFPVADADKLAHDAVAPDSKGLGLVVQGFGPEYLKQDQGLGISLDRIKMGQLVFSDSKARTKLENIIHPIVQKEIQSFKKMAEQSKQVV